VGPDGLGLGGGAPFLAACTEQSCGEDLECTGGVCTRFCSEDTECNDLSARAECFHGSSLAPGSGSCAVPCSSDDGCKYLGAGSYCQRAYCVAGNLDALPPSFEVLTLRNVSGAPPSAELSVCDPNEYKTSLTVNLRNRTLSWTNCALSEGGGYSLGTSRRELDEAAIALVQSAYRQLGISREPQCERGAEVLTLDIERSLGADMLYADAEHSACPAPRVERNSFVSGLNDLYSALVRLGGFSP
jgi:hypothetical protein